MEDHLRNCFSMSQSPLCSVLQALEAYNFMILRIRFESAPWNECCEIRGCFFYHHWAWHIMGIYLTNIYWSSTMCHALYQVLGIEQ